MDEGLTDIKEIKRIQKLRLYVMIIFSILILATSIWGLKFSYDYANEIKYSASEYFINKYGVSECSCFGEDYISFNFDDEGVEFERKTLERDQMLKGINNSNKNYSLKK